MNDLETMACNFYGYGRWSAPYWFIGIEQGGGDNPLRAEAFKELQTDGLCDCREFHTRIGETRWHSEDAKIQKTWGRLMMFLASFCDCDSGEGSLLKYQQQHWGMREGDTCVIDLRGLSATGLHIKVDRKKYVAKRINTIRQKLAENAPLVAVMYGFTADKYFNEIAGCSLVRGGSVRSQKSLFVFVDHPARWQRGNTDDRWKNLGALARAQMDENELGPRRARRERA